MPNWEEIQKEWETSKITLASLAEKYEVKLGTLKSRKSREGWEKDSAKKVATTQKDAVQENEKVATKKASSSESGKKGTSSNGKKKEQRRRGGNPNPENQFSHRNNPKLMHGLRSKFLHEDQVEIMEAMEGSSFVDQLWLQIEIKFSAIIRMQKIMWVDDEQDHLKEESGYSNGSEGHSTTYRVIYAHERYESYIKAQARAMAEYRNLVKQYLEFTDEFDERRLKLEQMRVGIDRTKAEIDKLNGDGDDGPIEILISRKDGR